MSMQQFRSAMGGFNRQDVLTYIDASAKAHAQDMEQLRAELEQTRTRAQEFQARAEAAEYQVAELAPRAAQMEKATAELEAKRSALAAAERELKELKARVAMLEPKADAYEAVKEKTAGIELEAHQRAKQVVDEAQAHAAAIRSQTEQWLTKVKGSYERLRTDVEATVNHTAGELERASKALTQVNREFRDHDTAMQVVTEAVKNSPEKK